MGHLKYGLNNSGQKDYHLQKPSVSEGNFKLPFWGGGGYLEYNQVSGLFCSPQIRSHHLVFIQFSFKLV